MEREARQGRQAVLQVIREASGPLAVADIAERVGLHVNTVRGHLELLVHLGVVSRETERRGGRGRPRVLYELAPDEPRQQDAYKTLAAALANEMSILGGTDQQHRRRGRTTVGAGPGRAGATSANHLGRRSQSNR